MNHVFNALTKLENTAGSKAKLAALVELGQCQDLRRVMRTALEQGTSFGLGQKTVVGIERELSEAFGEKDMGDDEWEILRKLANRELTGRAAEDAIRKAKAELTNESWFVFRRILLKDLRCGVTATLLNKAFPGELKIFAVMLAHKYDPARVKCWPVNIEPKLDGVRATSIVDTKEKVVKICSREGNQFTTFEAIEKSLLKAVELALPQASGILVFDGEISSGAFAQTAGDIHRKDYQAQDAVYHIFDMLTGAEFYEGSTTSQARRRTRLEGFFARLLSGTSFETLALMKSEKAYNHEEVMQKFDEYFSMGLEGAIAKQPEEPYVNKRSYGYMKLKNESSEDLEVIAVEEGEIGKQFEGLIGGYVVDFNGVKVSVSSGLTKAMREADPEEVIGRIIEVEYHEVTPDGSLRHPRFKRFRDTLKKGSKE